MDLGLAGRTAVITGGSGGIGAAIQKPPERPDSSVWRAYFWIDDMGS